MALNECVLSLFIIYITKGEKSLDDSIIEIIYWDRIHFDTVLWH